MVDRCWDLPGVNAHYLEFTERWRSELDRCETGVSSGDVTAGECFTLRFDLIHEFRAFPLEDPSLPWTLLPEQWHGGTATQLFHALHDVLEGPADQYVDGILAAAEAGVTAVVQPGGSIRDDQIVKACNDVGLAMLLTHRRHFRH